MRNDHGWCASQALPIVAPRHCSTGGNVRNVRGQRWVDHISIQKMQRNKYLIGFSTSVKRLLALMGEPLTMSLCPKADEWEY